SPNRREQLSMTLEIPTPKHTYNCMKHGQCRAKCNEWLSPLEAIDGNRCRSVERSALDLMELVQACTGPTIEAAAEVLDALVPRAVSVALQPREDPLIRALVAGD